LKKSSLLAIASLGFFAACSDITTPAQTNESIDGSFIVTVVDGVSPDVVAHDHGIVPQYVYHDALHGFDAFMSDEMHAALVKDTRVKSIEANEIEIEETTQNGATWGIDRTDQACCH
jgi:Peptidase inhibitor I9.